MDPITGGLIAAGGSLLGNIFNTTQNNANAQAMQGQAENYNTQMVQQQQNYETQMSNTAYQRATADMKAAGLNPMMMFGSGGPSSTPSISAPTIAPAQKSSAFGAVAPAIQGAISTALNLRTANATVDNLVQENANLKTKNELDKANIIKTGADAAASVASRGETQARTQLINENTVKAMNDAVHATNEREFRETPAGKLLDQAGMTGRNVSDVVSPIGSIVSSAKNAQTMFSDRWPY